MVFQNRFGHTKLFFLNSFHFFLELKNLDGWERLGYVDSFDASLDRPGDNVSRVDCSTLSHQDFIEQYEKKSIPVVLTGCQKHWMANRKWTLKVMFFSFFFFNYSNTILPFIICFVQVWFLIMNILPLLSILILYSGCCCCLGLPMP